MILRTLLRALLLSLPALALVTIAASAATTSVSTSGVDDVRRHVGANNLSPGACDGLDLTNLIVATGTVSGTDENDLILGGTGADTISGEGGDDCIVGGGGNDTLIGSDGDDVCIGGPGADALDGTCE